MTERLTDEQLRALQQSVRTDTLPQILAVQTAVAELLALRSRVAKLEVALKEIAKSSTRPGPPDFQYWWDTANDRRDIARAALKDAPK